MTPLQRLETAALAYALQAYGKPVAKMDPKKLAQFTDGGKFVLEEILPGEVAHWKQIAFELADGLDDIALFVRQFREDNKLDSPLFDLILKKKIAADRYIVRHKGRLVTKEEADEAKERERQMSERMTAALARK